mmetsp:Transcript_132608/g.369711  ORF Transcript_132608/g.369711 Transcript_132608/m.369711 type:complete len:253 (+) Transcript_132608:10-768(+)
MDTSANVTDVGVPFIALCRKHVRTAQTVRLPRAGLTKTSGSIPPQHRVPASCHDWPGPSASAGQAARLRRPRAPSFSPWPPAPPRGRPSPRPPPRAAPWRSRSRSRRGFRHSLLAQHGEHGLQQQRALVASDGREADGPVLLRPHPRPHEACGPLQDRGLQGHQGLARLELAHRLGPLDLQPVGQSGGLRALVLRRPGLHALCSQREPALAAAAEVAALHAVRSLLLVRLRAVQHLEDVALLQRPQPLATRG